MSERLDKLVTSRGLASSRERAQMLIEAGLVEVGGEVVQKVGQRVEEDAEIVVTGEALAYVGRGGLKLEAALKMFRLNVTGAVCLDVGASTGGFTDCLLQRGAKRVVALDVGHGQLAPSLAADPRVESREGVNARHLSPEQFTELFDIAVVDVSFISLTLILPAVAPLVRPGGHLVVLIKPEFEAGRQSVGPRGIVRNPEARAKTLEKITTFARETLKLETRGTMQSPAVGGGGNREYLACLRRPQEVVVAEGDVADKSPGPEGPVSVALRAKRPPG
jgi:23S rRNA (cytidine1920-2'-O)/16S rRNA (cytidine1409-2'-O)-methyltransferase